MYSFLHPPVLGTEHTVSSMLGNRPGFPFYFVWHTLALFSETRSHCTAQDSFQLRLFSVSGSHVLGYHVSLLNTKLNQVDGYLKGWRGKLATLGENPSSTQGSSHPPLALASTGSCTHPSQVTLSQLKILI